jgi:hypothetical protein
MQFFQDGVSKIYFKNWNCKQPYHYYSVRVQYAHYECLSWRWPLYCKPYCFNGLLTKYRKITCQCAGRIFFIFFQPFSNMLRTYMCRPWLMKTIELYANAIQHPIEKPPIILKKSHPNEKLSNEKPRKSQTRMFKRLSRLNSMSLRKTKTNIKKTKQNFQIQNEKPTT